MAAKQSSMVCEHKLSLRPQTLSNRRYYYLVFASFWARTAVCSFLEFFGVDRCRFCVFSAEVSSVVHDDDFEMGSTRLARHRQSVTPFVARSSPQFAFAVISETAGTPVERHRETVARRRGHAGADHRLFVCFEVVEFFEFDFRSYRWRGVLTRQRTFVIGRAVIFANRRRWRGASAFFFGRRRGFVATVVDAGFFFVRRAVILPDARFRTPVVAVAALIGVARISGRVVAAGTDGDDGHRLRAAGTAVVAGFAFLLWSDRDGRRTAVSTTAVRALGRALGRRLLLVRLVVLVMAATGFRLAGLVFGRRVRFARFSRYEIHAVALQEGDAIVPFLVAMPEHRFTAHVAQKGIGRIASFVRLVLTGAARTERVGTQLVARRRGEHLLFRTFEIVDDRLVSLVAGVGLVLQEFLAESVDPGRV